MKKEQIIKLVVLALAVVALGYVVFLYMKRSQNSQEEGFSSESAIKPSETLGRNEIFGSVNADVAEAPVPPGKPTDCFPKEQLKPSELLPGNDASAWASSVPTGQGELGDQNFLTAGYHVGVNTVGQSLRNANRQLRSEPANPQVKVSPWLQATIEPDINRKPLEIGASN